MTFGDEGDEGMLTDERLGELSKLDDEQFYGLDHDQVRELVNGAEGLIDQIRTLQQQNKQLIEAMEKMVNIDPLKLKYYEYLYHVCTVQEETMKSIQGGEQ
jgi:fructose-1,6-bisphosphatase